MKGEPMNKEQAIETLRANYPDACYEQLREAVDAAIEALKAQDAAGDTISRQAAIDALDVLCQEHRYRIPGKRETYSEYNEAWQDALDRAEGLIFNLPPIQPEPHWIPVSERLPEKCGEYLVSVHHTIGAISVFHPEKNTYVDDVAIMKYYGKFPSTVRAWMPLPEVYKPNNE